MQQLTWRGSGPDFGLNWGGRGWRLNVNEPYHGLLLETGESAPSLLALDLLAGPERCDRAAFTRNTLVDFERYRSSVRATYAPPSWGGVLVRASWLALPPGTVDLEIQLSASSVGELDGLEVGVASRLDPAAPSESAAPALYVESRDQSAASSVGDGREPLVRLCQFKVLSERQPLEPCLFASQDGTGDLCYAEMVHPDDLARRVFNVPFPQTDAPVPVGSVRYALFGLAIEKGVILRARLRGCWFHSTDPDKYSRSLYQEFLNQPPPLGP